MAAIVEIYNSTVASRQSTADLKPVSVAERQAWVDAHTGARPLYVLGNADGEVLAWGCFSDYYARPAYHISVEISVYCAPRYARRGRGQNLAAIYARASALAGHTQYFGGDFGLTTTPDIRLS